MRGIDVSHWEPNVDWAKVKAAGYDFAFMKASQGNLIDTSFKKFWSESKGIMLRGAYAFYDPRYSFNTPKIQAEFFWNLIKTDPGELLPVVDIEKYITGPYHGASYWYDFIDTFHRLSGIWPMIYTGYYYWTDNVKVAPVDDVTWFSTHCPLWIARYGASKPMVPPPWTDWTYWQYSETGMVDGVTDELGRPTECDLDIYREITEETNMWYIVNVSADSKLNMRSGAGTNYQDIGDLFRGDRIEVLGQTMGGWVPISRVLRVNGSVETYTNAWCSNAWLQPTADPFPPTSEPTLTHTIKIYSDGRISIDGGTPF